MTDCVLCQTDGAEIVHRTESWRVLLVDDPNFPGFCRVVMNKHIKEMTDMSEPDRESLMSVIWLVERAVRDAMYPDKINLATLGNMVPHMHWHIIPRYKDDITFPDSIWSQPRRVIASDVLETRKKCVSDLRKILKERLTARYGQSH